MGAAKRTLLQFPGAAGNPPAQVSLREEQPAEASAVRSRRSVDPHSMLFPNADEFATGSIPIAKSPWWIKLAVVAGASVISLTVALAFRPKPAVATAPSAIAATPGAAAVSVGSPEHPSAMAASPTPATEASASSAAQRAVPSSRPGHAAGIEGGRKPSHVRSALRPHSAGEIVDPWGK